MPFKSEAQRRWMWANDPVMAARWEAETPAGALPARVGECIPVPWRGRKAGVVRIAGDAQALQDRQAVLDAMSVTARDARDAAVFGSYFTSWFSSPSWWVLGVQDGDGRWQWKHRLRGQYGDIERRA